MSIRGHIVNNFINMLTILVFGVPQVIVLLNWKRFIKEHQYYRHTEWVGLISELIMVHLLAGAVSFIIYGIIFTYKHGLIPAI